MKDINSYKGLIIKSYMSCTPAPASWLAPSSERVAPRAIMMRTTPSKCDYVQQASRVAFGMPLAVLHQTWVVITIKTLFGTHNYSISMFFSCKIV